MGQTLTTWTTRTRAKLGTPLVAQISDADLQDHIRAGIRQFSTDRPRILYSDYNGDSVTFSLTIPAAWIDGFASVIAIEYPQGEREPLFLDMAEVELYPGDSDPTHIRLKETTPSTGKVARVFFSSPWPIPTATGSDDKISDTDYEPVTDLSAAKAALEMAARAAGTRKSGLPSADAAEWETEEGRWQAIARALLKSYNDHVGTEEGGVPASGTTDWDASSLIGGQFIFRGRR